MNSPHDTKFWLEHPQVLVSNANILSQENDCLNSKLNNATKLVIIIALILLLLRWKYWAVFLVVCLLIILIIYLSNQSSNDSNNDIVDDISNKVKVRNKVAFGQILKSKLKNPWTRGAKLRENFNEDLNNFTFYANDIDDKNFPITKMSDIVEKSIKPLSECFTYILEPLENDNTLVFEEPITLAPVLIKPTNNIEEQMIPDMIEEPKSEIYEQPKMNFAVSAGLNNKPLASKIAPKRKNRKTAYELQREAYMSSYQENGVDTVERDRHNLINGLY